MRQIEGFLHRIKIHNQWIFIKKSTIVTKIEPEVSNCKVIGQLCVASMAFSNLLKLIAATESFIFAMRFIPLTIFVCFLLVS